jgi:hypothetical protein
MSELTTQQKTLSAQWAAVHEGAGQALAWIEDVRGNAPRLDSEADGLNLRLHRARNQAKNFARAATTPMTVGFFGLSQAGKSYLISTLAAGANGKLETEFGSQRLDFIEHINPVGGGKEATGLVTRFSRRAQPGPDADFPIELQLFSEVEIAKILANTWFKDFDQEQLHYEIDEARIQNVLKRFEGRDNGPVVAGLNADDVVSLWDYLQENFKASVRKLQHLYWPRVIKLAPRLSIAQRGELFSLLWGEQPELTRVYEKLGTALRNLNNAGSVFAPLSALVSRDANGDYSKLDSIMNVDILARFDTAQDSNIDVRPVLGGELGPRTSLTVAQLAALTTEMTFRLVNPPQDPVIEQVDVLDFPGYRGRMKMRSIDESSAAGGSTASAVSQLLLRGKVAYLFERYTDCQEMNALVLCTNSEKQIEVPDVVPVITRWIEKTQGSDPAERARMNGTGLIWAMTMLDKRINDSLDTPPSALNTSWDNMMQLAMLERFGALSWMNDWAGKPFCNTFLVRKPRMRTSFIDLCESTGNELQVKASARPLIDALGTALVNNQRVNRHIHAPSEAWQALLTINDGGIKRFSQSFAAIANTAFKLQRISEEYQRCHDDLLPSGISPWYHKDGDGAVALKRTQAQMILSQLGKNLEVMGELISHLQVPSETVRDLYLSGVYDDDADADADAAADPQQPAPAQSLYGNSASLDFGNSLMFDLGGDLASDTLPASVVAQPELQSTEHRFAKAVFKEWVAHLRDVPGRDHLLHGLGLNKKVIEAAVDEIITAAYRLDLPDQLAKAVLKRAQSGARRDQLVERQVLEVQLVLRDFVSWFGFVHNPVEQRPKSLVGNRDHLFAYYRDVAVGQLPELPAQPIDQAQVFLGDWLSGLANITMANAGHGAGREISPEQNERLGRVLTTFQAS